MLKSNKTGEIPFETTYSYSEINMDSIEYQIRAEDTKTPFLPHAWSRSDASEEILVNKNYSARKN